MMMMMMMMMENKWKKNIPVIVKPCKNVSLSFPVVMGSFVPSETLTLACAHTQAIILKSWLKQGH